MYISWRRQENLNQSQRVERTAAKVAREVLFYRAGYSASIPAWAKPIADDTSIATSDVRGALAETYNDICHR